MHMQAQSGREGIAPNHLQHGSRRRWLVSTTPRLLYSQERFGTHCTGDWVGFGAGLDGHGKSRPHRDSIPDCLMLRILFGTFSTSNITAVD